ncbi:MAG: Tfp pilus assembly protein FimT/FimU [Gemmatimonadales bacterium]
MRRADGPTVRRAGFADQLSLRGRGSARSNLPARVGILARAPLFIRRLLRLAVGEPRNDPQVAAPACAHISCPPARLPACPPGFTLLEVIVALAVLGVLYGLTTMAFTNLKPTRESEIRDFIVQTRLQAVKTGKPLTITVDSAGMVSPRVIRFLPDGRALGEGYDPWTGAARSNPMPGGGGNGQTR